MYIFIREKFNELGKTVTLGRDDLRIIGCHFGEELQCQ
jgi:hypothetical protein